MEKYITPPYSETMIRVLKNLENRVDIIIDNLVKNGVEENEAKEMAIKIITMDIKPVSE